jgi:uncharacterized protein (TIGR02145 family)
VAYASLYGFNTGTRANNIYVAVTTDKALYTWTRKVAFPVGEGQVLNLNLATADDRYTIKGYTTTPEGRMAKQIYNAHNEREYLMGERIWMTANLRWRGYCGDLGTASTDANYAKEFGTYYNYYEAAETKKDSGWSTVNPLGAKAVVEGRQGEDEMGLSLKYTLFSTGVGYGGTQTTNTINVALDPKSDAGKTLRGQWQFVCPKGWHLSNYTDWYHLAIAVADTYARGTSWTNGEAGFSGGYFNEADKEGTSPKNPFCNAAVSHRTDNTTLPPRSMGFVFGQTFFSTKTPAGESAPVAADRYEYWGMAVGSWLRAGTNQKHGGLWHDHLTDDTEHGYYYKWNDTYKYLSLFVSTDAYTSIYNSSNKAACNPATILVNAGAGTPEAGAAYVGFNAYPAGMASFTGESMIYRYACFMQPMTINAATWNGLTAMVELDYNQNGIRMGFGKARGTGKGNQMSVRCVKNYEHYDLK